MNAMCLTIERIDVLCGILTRCANDRVFVLRSETHLCHASVEVPRRHLPSVQCLLLGIEVPSLRSIKSYRCGSAGPITLPCPTLETKPMHSYKASLFLVVVLPLLLPLLGVGIIVVSGYPLDDMNLKHWSYESSSTTLHLDLD